MERKRSIIRFSFLLASGPAFINGCTVSGLRSQPLTPDHFGTPPSVEAARDRACAPARRPLYLMAGTLPRCQRWSAAFVSSKELPSANVIFCRYPYSERSLAPTPSTLMACPTDLAKSARPTPTRRNHAGGLLSKTQLSAFPSSAFASM